MLEAIIASERINSHGQCVYEHKISFSRSVLVKYLILCAPAVLIMFSMFYESSARYRGF